MQLFILGFIIMSICEIFTNGGFPLDSRIRIVSGLCPGTTGLEDLIFVIQGFTGAHIAIITSTCWMLMLNGAVGFQVIDDGSFFSVFLMLGSTACIFIGTGYIALDTGYRMLWPISCGL